MSFSIERLLGGMLRGVHAGERHLASNDASLATAPERISLTSSAFADGGIIPLRYAGAGVGENISPPLSWSGVPDEAAELVLIIEDPDAPLPRPVVHAIATGIPPNWEGLKEGALTPAEPPLKLGRGAFGRRAYAGPRAISGHGPHHYIFQLVAVDRALSFAEPPTLAVLLSAIRGAVVAKGRLIGTFEKS